MSIVSPDHHIRLARPSRDLQAAERFWCDGVGLEVLWRTGAEAEGGHALLMVGAKSANWHLELVHDPEALDLNPPGPEDLLVIYRSKPATVDELARLTTHGGAVKPARNPYWDANGVTLQDPDGYLLVLASRSWT